MANKLRKRRMRAYSQRKWQEFLAWERSPEGVAEAAEALRGEYLIESVPAQQWWAQQGFGRWRHEVGAHGRHFVRRARSSTWRCLECWEALYRDESRLWAQCFHVCTN